MNNQRSSKAKGALKKDREEKLISTGLKWSVLVTNSWEDMINELRVYVKEKVRNGNVWYVFFCIKDCILPAHPTRIVDKGW